MAGANLPTVQAMANEAAATWNPAAKGRRSLVIAGHDNDTTWHCQEDAVQAWSPRPPHVVYLCPKFSLANAGKLRQVLLQPVGAPAWRNQARPLGILHMAVWIATISRKTSAGMQAAHGGL